MFPSLSRRTYFSSTHNDIECFVITLDEGLCYRMGSLRLTASLVEGGGAFSLLNYTLMLALQVRKMSEKPQSSLDGNCCAYLRSCYGHPWLAC
jgi:hypothetical protein